MTWPNARRRGPVSELLAEFPGVRSERASYSERCGLFAPRRMPRDITASSIRRPRTQWLIRRCARCTLAHDLADLNGCMVSAARSGGHIGPVPQRDLLLSGLSANASVMARPCYCA
jgi:hypothetical protein